MIIEYHRPQNLDEALKLLARQEPKTVPLGGGSSLSHYKGDPIAVVDLQNLGLNQVEIQGTTLKVGATATLQQLLDFPGTPEPLKKAIQWEVSLNLRNTSSIAGTLVMADGRSTIATILLAMDTRFTWMPGKEEMSLPEWLPNRTIPKGSIISEILIPLQGSVQYESIGRTPADTPVVIVAMNKKPSGQVRIAAGGFGPAPVTAFDGMLKEIDVIHAIENVFMRSDDSWASAEYRKNAASIITRRLLLND